MAFKFITLKQKSMALYKEKGSKFYAYAYPVIDPDQVRDQLEMLKKAHHKARHCCFAYILGAEGKKYRAFDDGEPRHSAGDPILGQIRSKELTNVLVAVVRYFGGTKLGLGGLTLAYKEAARRALDLAGSMECEVTKRWELTFPYTVMGEVKKALREFDIKPAKQRFDEHCWLQLDIPESRNLSFKRRLQPIHHLKVDIH